MVRIGESDVNKAKQGSMTDRQSDRRQCTDRKVLCSMLIH